MINNLINKSKIAQGDQRKFKQLMDLTADELLLFAMGFIRNKEIAEEIVSDVFVKIWGNRKEVENIKNLKSYLFISVKNGCLTHLRKIKKENVISIDQFSDFHFLPVEGPENDYIDNEIRNEIYQSIEKLPPKCKLAFTLAKINGLKYKEIAEVMGVSEKTVNNHLVTAVKKIAETLNGSKHIDEKPSPLKRASLF
jgi:RNA polymerase sigma-70 factor (ECF subfamily)